MVTMKPVRLTQKEIDRADRTFAGYPFTIVARPQATGGYWVAAVNLDTGKPVHATLGQQVVSAKEQIHDAVVQVGRDLHKHLMVQTVMTDKMRHDR